MPAHAGIGGLVAGLGPRVRGDDDIGAFPHARVRRIGAGRGSQALSTDCGPRLSVPGRPVAYEAGPFRAAACASAPTMTLSGSRWSTARRLSATSSAAAASRKLSAPSPPARAREAEHDRGRQAAPVRDLPQRRRRPQDGEAVAGQRRRHQLLERQQGLREALAAVAQDELGVAVGGRHQLGSARVAAALCRRHDGRQLLRASAAGRGAGPPATRWWEARAPGWRRAARR